MDNLTVYCLDGRTDYAALEKSAKAVRLSAERMDCKGILAAPVINPYLNVEQILCPELKNHNDYSKYLLEYSHQHIKSAFTLFVQADGFVLRPEKFDPEFLKYDYIGAPWPQTWDIPYRVGNGGFSLRSQRFLYLSSVLANKCKVEVEDVVVCRTYRELLEKNGITFAPIELAAQFSLEHFTEFNQDETFGFHGSCNDKTIEYCKSLDSYE